MHERQMRMRRGQGYTLGPGSPGSCAPTKLRRSKFQCFPWPRHQKSVLTPACIQPWNFTTSRCLLCMRYISRSKETCWPRNSSRPSVGPRCPATRPSPRTSGFIRTLYGQRLLQNRHSRRAQLHQIVLPPARHTCLPPSTRRLMSMSTHAFVAIRRLLWPSLRG